MISYFDDTNDDIKVAHCSNTNCTAATINALDSIGGQDEGWELGSTSITIGADGLGMISYHDDTNQDLKVAHCENAFCSPYFRRR